MAILKYRWDFEGDVTEQINGLQGVLTGSLSTSASKVGDYHLNYSSYVTTESVSAVVASPTAQFTITFWEKFPDPALASDPILFRASSPMVDDGLRFFKGSLNYANLSIRSSDGDYNYWYYNNLGNTTGLWSFYALTYDYSKDLVQRVNLYVNTVEVTPYSTSLSDLNQIMASSATIIGGDYGGGEMDDLRIYEGILSTEDITYLYNNTVVTNGYPIIKFSDQDPSNKVIDNGSSGSLHVTVINFEGENSFLSSSQDSYGLMEGSIGEIDYNTFEKISDTQVEFDVVNISAYGTVTVSAINLQGISASEYDSTWYYSADSNKLLNLTNFLPNHLYDSDVYNFTKFFEDFLNTMYVNSDSTANEGILRKIEKIRDFNDPELIDIDYVNFFARKVGYNVDVTRGTIGLFSTSGTNSYEDLTGDDLEKANKYIRFVLSNLPNWYKIKTTQDSIKIMLFSFGIVGDLVTYFTNDYDQNWLPEDNNDGTNITNEIPEDYYPSSHFAIQVNLRDSEPTWFSSIDKVVAAVDSIRPINTVFEGIDGIYTEDTYTVAITTNVESGLYVYLSWEGSPATI